MAYTIGVRQVETPDIAQKGQGEGAGAATLGAPLDRPAVLPAGLLLLLQLAVLAPSRPAVRLRCVVCSGPAGRPLRKHGFKQLLS